jgi:hypothetical protein
LATWRRTDARRRILAAAAVTLPKDRRQGDDELEVKAATGLPAGRAPAADRVATRVDAGQRRFRGRADQ